MIKVTNCQSYEPNLTALRLAPNFFNAMPSLSPIVNFLVQPQPGQAAPIIPVALGDLSTQPDDTAYFQTLNSAFLIVLAGAEHPDFIQAKTVLDQLAGSAKWGNWAKFYLKSLALMTTELDQYGQSDADLAAKLQQVETTLANGPTEAMAIAETIWSVLFPEGVEILGHETEGIEALRQKRTMSIHQLNPNPIENPARQVLFTSNALLTTPLAGADLSEFDLDFQAQVAAASQEPQLYWYDHPIPIGVPAESNEILYGLVHLNEAVAFERQQQPNMTDPVTCVLSVSVTHKRLQTLGKSYLKQVLAASPPLEQLNVFAFTEADTDALVNQVLRPIIQHSFPQDDAAELLSVFGVDGCYGRHYSFLKAITAVWNVLIDPEIRATFKIDLDQVFPQAELVEQTGQSAFEHLTTPLWGAVGEDAQGNPVELGMVAGALVNQKDIHQGVFTPDVRFPTGGLQADDYVFFSKLPQALSTEAEMMSRYDESGELDGFSTCLQRIHVTGGTNGILVDSLRRYQPFTPSFIGRAEDQAYVLTALQNRPRLGYAHASGLIMRHDKEGFAQEAISKAKVGKQIGDYVRILMFSAYAQALAPDISQIKAIIDPFTGCFASRLPINVTLLRFALRVATLFHTGQTEEAIEFIQTGVPQLDSTLDFVQGKPSPLETTYQREAEGWRLFYQALTAVEKAQQAGADWVLPIQAAAQKIVAECRVN